ncbi:MAG: response regulator [bacterium]|nr:response regulator [bacterium]
MGNAAKFTEKGEIELFLDIETERNNKFKFHVQISDTGIGIPEEKLDTIFDVFQQAEDSTTRKYGGTGLGLSICKQIATLMGGDVRVESEVNKGSTFHFTAWMDKSHKKSEKKNISVDLTGKKALLVDDNDTNLEILDNVLMGSKMQVVKLRDPAKVLQTIKECPTDDPFHICIIDTQMRGKSGFDVAREVRALDGTSSKLPLLAFSSSTANRKKVYKEAGFSGYLPKPVRRAKLLKMVERLLSNNDTPDDKIKKETILTRHSITEEVKHSIHILLAEDNPINRKLAGFLLTKTGYRLTMVVNGREAVETYTADPNRFDIILMDIQMPEMNGLEATRLIREMGFRKVPIVAMTAQSIKGDKEKCLECGMNDFISKPVKRDIIFSIIKKWCIN